jgi:small conductance mechanosensitive channel
MLDAIGLTIAGLLAVLILQTRSAVAQWIRGSASESSRNGLRVLRTRVSDIWHILALLYVMAIYGVWALQVPGGFEFITQASIVSIVVLVAARLLACGGESLLRKFFAINKELKQRFPGLEERAGRHFPY